MEFERDDLLPENKIEISGGEWRRQRPNAGISFAMFYLTDFTQRSHRVAFTGTKSN